MSRAFTAFHWTLGLVVFTDSLRTALGAAANPHLLALASLETLAAALFLWPRTLRLGAALLIAVFAVALLAHAWRGQLSGALLVYAAGAVLVGLDTPAPARRELS